MRILITGSNGLLGQKIVGQLIRKKINFLATSLGDNRNPHCPKQQYAALDICDPVAVSDCFTSYLPDAVINTAAMTNVDECEENEQKCRRINVDAVANLYGACQKSGVHLIQLSTDFVFDGKNGPYQEDDERNPLSIYAVSKRNAEDILLDDPDGNWSILRTIIVFGTASNLSRSNIVLWAKDALKSGQPLNIVDDQFRAPTWADDLAWACIRTAVLHKKGVFHISGPETMSIIDLVRRIGRFHDLPTDQITAVSSSTLNQKAKRPPRTGFILTKAAKELGYKPMTFEESLKLLENEQG